jgi:transcriptional regulator with XRE-family HTH domain
MTILLREAIGDRLRHARTSSSRTLRDVSRAARVSLGYLSEVERGRKEASSELLSAICEALELPLSDLLHNVASDMGAMAGVDDVGAGVAAAETERRGAGIEGGRMTPTMSGTDMADLRIASKLRIPTTSIETGLTAKSGVTVAA